MSSAVNDPIAAVSERARSLCSLLDGEAKVQGERVVEVCRSLIEGDMPRTTLPPDNLALRIELGRLVEYLSRRGSNAIPLATLGRAALAALAGDQNAVVQACRECDRNLTMLGL